MAKHLNVSLDFSANTSQAQAQLQKLQYQLTQIVNTSNLSNVGELGLTKEIQSAITAAAELKVHLENATNVNTGTLDFSKLNESIERSGSSILEYGDRLAALGPQGTEAFQSLARAVASSEIPIKRTNTLVSELWVTLKNAARWQLSSSALHSFMGALQTSYGYAQDLNESLNNIRIVTGQSTEQMAEFAEQANKAARTLSATTLDYTDAALIYYQQGLSDEEVQERTNTTIKLANVSGQTADEVSDQMTAIWNNFDDGSQSLEYYADVITALGAATASSSSEIAEGLSKFASVADTVGLSYEYATSALATVVATTRQSADTVGQAFKTLFARIQDLELGETLDDGTTLGAYAEALNKVGINIKDQNGDLKEMDTILDEMGAKWSTLSQDQQVALAENVAGVRQYTQLMALMNNWDFFKENLGVATESEGTLQEQADIYAESWEAAQNRVSAAAQAIYSDLLDEDFFIGFDNLIEKALVGLDSFIDGIGGLKGVLLGLGAIVTKVFSKQIAIGLSDLTYNLKTLTEKGRTQIKNQRDQVMQGFIDTISGGTGTESAVEQAKATALTKELELQNQLTQKVSEMDEYQVQASKSLIDTVRLKGESLALSEKELELYKEELSNQSLNMRANAYDSFNENEDNTDNIQAYNDLTNTLKASIKAGLDLDEILQQINQTSKNGTEQIELTDEQIESIRKDLESVGTTDWAIENIIADLKEATSSGEGLENALAKIKHSYKSLTKEQTELLSDQFGLSEEEIKEWAAAYEEVEIATRKAAQAQNEFDSTVNTTSNYIENAKRNQLGWQESLVQTASGISSVTFALQSLSNVFETLKDPDVSGWEKFTTLMFGLGTAIPGLIQGYKSLSGVATPLILQITNLAAAHFAAKGAIDKENAAVIASVLLDKKRVAKILEVIASEGSEAAAHELNTAGIAKENAQKIIQILLNKKLLVSILELLGPFALFVIAAAGIGLAIYGVVKWLDSLIVTSKEAAEAMESATESYENAKSEVEELESSLQEVEDRIKEINEQDSISTLDEEELNKLERQKVLLEAQLALKEKIAKDEQQKQVETISENFQKANSWANEEASAYIWRGGTQWQVSNEDQLKNVYDSDAYSGYIDDLIAKSQDDTQTLTETESKTLESYMNNLTKVEQAQSDWVSSNQENYEQAESDFESYMAGIQNGITDDNMDAMIAEITKVRKAMYSEGEYEEYFLKNAASDETLSTARVSASGTVDLTADQITDLQYRGIDTEEFTDYIQQAYNDVVDNLPDAISAEDVQGLDFSQIILLSESLDSLSTFNGDNILDFINGLEEESANVSALDDIKSRYTELQEIISSLSTGDTISADDMATLGDSYKQYFEEQLDGTYMLIGSAKELKSLVSDITLGELKSSIRSDQEQLTDIGQQVLGTGYSDEDFENLVHKAEKGVLTQENQTKFIDAVTEAYGGSYETVEEAAAAVREHQQALLDEETALASTAESVEELNDLYATGQISIEAYNKTVKSTALKEASAEGFDSEEVLEYAQALKTVSTNEKLTEEQALKIAVANKKLDKGISSLSDNWSDWSTVLKKGNKGTSEYVEAVAGVKDALEDILDVDIDNLSDDFITSTETADLLQRAVDGDLTAIEELRQAAAQDIMVKAGVDTEAAEQALSDFASALDDLPDDITIGTEIDNTAAFEGLQALLDSGNMTVEQMNAALSAIGWEPVVEYEEIPLEDAQAAKIQGYTRVGDEYVPFDMTQEAESGTTVWVPKIKSTTYRGSAPTTASTPKQSSSGGGSSSKTHDQKTDSDKERYHTITNQLEDLTSEYDDLSDAKDRAFGSDRLKVMDDEIAKTKELIAKQKEYVSAISENLPLDKDIMVSYYSSVIGGTIEFDERGNISNYDEIQDAMYAKYNAMAAQSLDDTTWDVFEKKYEQLEKYIEQYEETYDLLREQEQEYQDLLNQLVDEQLEKIQYQIEMKIDIADDGLSVLEFQLERLEDKSFAAAEAIDLFGEKADLLYDKIQADREGLRQALTINGETNLSDSEINQIISGDFDFSLLKDRNFTDDQISAIKDYRDSLLDLNSELLEVKESVEDEVMEVFDDLNEKVQDGIDKFDTYNSILENYQNIIDIVGKSYLKVNNSMLKALNQATIDNSINKVKATKKAYDAMLQSQQAAELAYRDALARGIEDDISYWEDTLSEIEKEVSEAQETMMQAWEDALQAAADAFDLAVETAVDTFEKALTPFTSLDEFSEAYDQQKELSDQYLEDYQKIYELSKLSRDVNNSIDDTKIIGGKQKLKALLNDINALQEDGVQMSEYDLEYLQKTYDLRMAEIELEEAQSAKDTVRLARDTEGNWSYAYTTNTSAVDDATQKYEDALYAMQELSSNYIDDMSEQLISTSQDMEEALAAVRVEDYASIEEYYKKLDEIQSYYLERMTYMQNEMQKALDNNKALYEEDWQNYSAATGYKISDNDKFMTSYQDTILGTLLGSESDIVDFQERVNEALGDAYSCLIGELLQAYLDWSQNTDDAMIAAGTSSENFADDMSSAVDQIGDSSETAVDYVNDMADQMIAGFQSVTSAVDVWQSHYSSAMEQVIEDNLNVIESYNLLLNALRSGSSTGQISEAVAADVSDYKQSIATDNDASRFDTGGYTGTWNSTPKWGLLDQKELILNAEDTQNMLSAISLTRDILKTIDLNANFASQGLGALVASTIRDDATQTLEQVVSISAEFPNVTDHNEIETALNNLINTSAQYANRKD